MTEWKCKRCGLCCGIVPFLPEEYEKVKDTGIEFEQQIMENQVVYFPKYALQTMRCPFYDKKKKICTIYENRPEVCRLFGDGEHPCLICPHNPRYNKLAIEEIAEKVVKRNKKCIA